jgi:hypothetical protein
MADYYASSPGKFIAHNIMNESRYFEIDIGAVYSSHMMIAGSCRIDLNRIFDPFFYEQGARKGHGAWPDHRLRNTRRKWRAYLGKGNKQGRNNIHRGTPPLQALRR